MRELLKNASKFIVDIQKSLNPTEIVIIIPGTKTTNPATMVTTEADPQRFTINAGKGKRKIEDPNAEGVSISMPFFLINVDDVKFQITEDHLIEENYKKYRIVKVQPDYVDAAIKLWVEDV